MIGTHRAGRERESRTGDGAAQVVVGVAVTAGKVRAGEAENFVHLGGSPTLPQQVFVTNDINCPNKPAFRLFRFHPGIRACQLN
jgi:hypothetical protein